MFARSLSVFLSLAVALASLPPPADAQFGLRRSLKGAAPTRIAPGGALPLAAFGGKFRGAFGVVAAVAVGSAILGALSQSERREVARRAKTVVAKDPDQRVTDTYTSKDGTKQVTIVAEAGPKRSAIASRCPSANNADAAMRQGSRAARSPPGSGRGRR